MTTERPYCLACRFLPPGVRPHDRDHDEVDGECVRCGEWTWDYNRAEVAEGLVHQTCMKEGEQIA